MRRFFFIKYDYHRIIGPERDIGGRVSVHRTRFSRTYVRAYVFVLIFSPRLNTIINARAAAGAEDPRHRSDMIDRIVIRSDSAAAASTVLVIDSAAARRRLPVSRAHNVWREEEEKSEVYIRVYKYIGSLSIHAYIDGRKKP